MNPGSSYYLNENADTGRRLLTTYYRKRSLATTTEMRNLWAQDPWKLVYHMNRRSQIFETDAVTDPTLYNVEKEYSDEQLNAINNILFKWIDMHPDVIVRGDVVHLTQSGNHLNKGKLIWDGCKLINLDYSSDASEHGSVPIEFEFPEFDLDHFYVSIKHSYSIYVSDAGLEIMKKRFISGRNIISLPIKERHFEIHFERNVDSQENSEESTTIDSGEIFEQHLKSKNGLLQISSIQLETDRGLILTYFY